MAKRTVEQIEAELDKLEIEESKDKKELSWIVRAFIVFAIIALPSIFYLGAKLNSSSRTILDDQKRIATLKDSLTKLEGQAPSSTGGRITLTAEEIRATIQLACDVNGDGYVDGYGSGTIWDKTGLIYTNKHLIAKIQKQYNPRTLQAYENSVCAVGITEDIEKASTFRYLAVPFQYSRGEDVALMTIVSDINGRKLSDGKEFETIPLGDSSNEKLPPGSYVAVIGYPAQGALTWTYTEGIVSGRFETYIKTDAQINPGNSGGTALNVKKEYVGIPTFGFAGGINYILSIDVVRDLKDWVTVKR